MRVLLSAPYMIRELDRFRPILEASGVELIVPEVRERLTEHELLGFAGQFDGVICGDDRFTRQVLERAVPRLKVISKWGTGIDSIDLIAAADLGVRVRNTPGAFTVPVADSVMSYILAFARQTPWMDRMVKSGVWEKRPALALGECCVGIVGVGRIGKAVARRARAFGADLLGNDIVEVDPEFLEETGVEMTNFSDLLRRADFVTLNCDLNPSSFHLIGEKELKQMQVHSILINTSRGPVVDQPALVRALEEGWIAGAALDVFEDEPLPVDSPLLGMENVLLAPHNANSSPGAWERVHWNTLINLFEGLGVDIPETVAEMAAMAPTGAAGSDIGGGQIG